MNARENNRFPERKMPRVFRLIGGRCGWGVLPLALLLVMGLRCVRQSGPLVNLSHLNALFQIVRIGEEEMGIVRIYAEYPDYQPVAAPGEGIACVDDAARAILVYLEDYERHGHLDSWQRVELLVRFLLYMQSPDGTFYNFIWEDGSINRNGPTSVNRPDWWTWRAQWALARALPQLRAKNVPLALQTEHALELSFSIYKTVLAAYPDTVVYNGLVCPAYLPLETGADQAAVMLLALEQYLPQASPELRGHRVTQAEQLARGILLMQTGDSLQFPYGAFRSWQNLWHAWGNSQSHALLSLGYALQKENWVRHALLEVRYFYPYLLEEQFLHALQFRAGVSGIQIMRREAFPQIAYDIRPMVMASLMAYRITGQAAYARQAGQLAAWLFGNNPARAIMYDARTGRCFDGLYWDAATIKGAESEAGSLRINRNAGAESTIEALMILQAIERNPIAWAEMHRFRRQLKKVPRPSNEKTSHLK